MNESNRLSRECLVTALIQLLQEKPLSALSISEITARAGVSRMTYYRNYKSKEDIFVQTLNSMLTEYYHEFAPLSDGQSRYYGYENLLHFFTYFERCREFISSMFHAGLSHLLLACLSDYIVSVWYHPENGDTIETYYTLQAFSGSLYNVYARWALNGRKETPQQLAQTLSGIYGQKP